MCVRFGHDGILIPTSTGANLASFSPPLFFNLSLFVSIEKKGFKKIKIKKKTKKSHQ